LFNFVEFTKQHLATTTLTAAHLYAKDETATKHTLDWGSLNQCDQNETLALIENVARRWKCPKAYNQE
jgi:hypothetical protein